MGLKNLICAGSRAICKTGLAMRNHKGDILFGVGLIGFGLTIAGVCAATYKFTPELDNATKEIEKINASTELPEEKKQEEIVKVRKKVSRIAVHYYWKPMVIAGITVLGFTGAQLDVKEKCNNYAMMYSGLLGTFASYRKNVIAEEGKEKDLEYLFGKKTEEVTTIADDGSEVVEYKKKLLTDGSEAKKIASRAQTLIFDMHCDQWTKSPNHNKYLILQVQEYLNNRLRLKGYIFLNEVYRALGAPETEAGQYVGWIYDARNPVGDNYIDFGLYSDCNQRFLDGLEPSCILEFNVDGIILGKTGLAAL